MKVLCSFCNKTSDEVECIIAADVANICSECIQVCVECVEDFKDGLIEE